MADLPHADHPSFRKKKRKNNTLQGREWKKKKNRNSTTNCK